MEKISWDVEKMYSMPCSNIKLGWSAASKRSNFLSVMGVLLFAIPQLKKRGVILMGKFLSESNNQSRRVWL